jgi:hypothetical protein
MLGWSPDPPGAPDDLSACQSSPGHGPSLLHPSSDRAVLAANADTEVLRHYDDELDAAFEEAREQGDLAPLVQTVRRWWFEADAWRDPDAQREFLARIEKYQNEGPPSRKTASAEKRFARSTASEACTDGSWTVQLSRRLKR